jgi:hypothetical protein
MFKRSWFDRIGLISSLYELSQLQKPIFFTPEGMICKVCFSVQKFIIDTYQWIMLLLPLPALYHRLHYSTNISTNCITTTAINIMTFVVTIDITAFSFSATAFLINPPLPPLPPPPPNFNKVGSWVPREWSSRSYS